MKNHPVLLIFLCLLVVPVSGLAEEAEKISGSGLFGSGEEYFHPYVTVSGVYDDNVYRTGQGKTGDYATVFSPGIWIAVPGTHEKMPDLKTYTQSPGGLVIVEDRGESFQRFQGFLHYGAELTRYQKEENNDTNDQRLEGRLQFNLKSGLRFEIFDMYLHDHNEREEGTFGQLNTYKSNLLGGRATYDLSSKFRVRGEYSHFNVDYDDDANKLVNRTDDKFASYLFYKLTGKSSVFVEYDLVNIRYDNLDTINSKEYTAWGGFRWRLSKKTMGEIKAGYLTKDYTQTGMRNTGDLVIRGWLDYEVSHKSRIKLTVARLVDEPDTWGLIARSQGDTVGSSNSSGAVDNQVKGDFIYDLTSRLRANVEGEYRKVTFLGDYRFNGVTGDRTDDRYTGILGLNYQIRPWIGTKVSYTHIDRESSFPGLSYIDNRVMVNFSVNM